MEYLCGGSYMPDYNKTKVVKMFFLKAFRGFITTREHHVQNRAKTREQAFSGTFLCYIRVPFISIVWKYAKVRSVECGNKE